MKKALKLGFVLALAALVLTGCSCYNKMLKKVDLIEVTCSPEILTLKGSQVEAEYTVKFPAKYFNKAAVVKFTPVLVYAGGEIAGASKMVQGEQVPDNYTVIPSKVGGSFTEKVAFDFKPEALLSTLEIRIEVKCDEQCKKRYVEFVPAKAIKVAEGISAVQDLVKRNYYAQYCQSNYKKVYTVAQDAEIMYNINSSVVRKNELSSEQIALFKEFVKSNLENDRATMGNVYAKGYASPDGTVKFNDALSKQRSQTGDKALKRQLKGMDVKYDVASYGEDWEGFKKLVEASDIEDKALILQVLKMYDNPVQRDQEIQNMSAVFKVLATEVLPKLRRTQFTASAEVKNLTDDELKALVENNDCEGLECDAALYVATLYKDIKTQIRIYTYAGEKFNCFRAYNNLGAVYIGQGNTKLAGEALAKAAKIKKAEQVSVNLAIVAVMEGKLGQAKGLLKNVKLPAAKSVEGVIDVLEGKYPQAIKKLSGYNKAVAEVCNGNLAAAKADVKNDKSMLASYLKAVIAMREGDSKAALANLKACSKGSNYRARMAKDIEFAKLFGTPEFEALL